MGTFLIRFVLLLCILTIAYSAKRRARKRPWKSEEKFQIEILSVGEHILVDILADLSCRSFVSGLTIRCMPTRFEKMLATFRLRLGKGVFSREFTVLI